jgi:RNA polymerase sigma-70 factor (sigma-E family)
VTVTFEEFVSSRLGALLRYATVVTWDPHLAEDVTQEVLVRAQLKWARIGRLDAPEAYVRRMVVNEFLSWRRRRAASPLSREALEAMAGSVPDHGASWGERDAVWQLIATLPARQRAAVALRFYEDMSYEEIAEVLGCRAVTARSQVSRALQTLRESLPSSSVLQGEL